MKNLLDLKELQVEETPGRIIRALRQNFNLTLKEIETLTEIPQTHLSAIENDKIDIGVKRAEVIAAAFGIDPALILFPQGHERKPNSVLQKIRARAKRLIEKKALAG